MTREFKKNDQIDQRFAFISVTKYSKLDRFNTERKNLPTTTKKTTQFRKVVIEYSATTNKKE